MILSEVRGFIFSIQKVADCSEQHELKVRSKDLYNRVVEWFPSNQANKDYVDVAILTFAMLEELYQRGGLEDSETKAMSRYAAEIIKRQDDLDSDFVDLLNSYIPSGSRSSDFEDETNSNEESVFTSAEGKLGG